MNIYKLFQWQRSFAADVARSEQIQPSKPIQLDKPIQPVETVPPNPNCVSAMDLNKLLDDTGRSKNSTPGDGHNNCGFNSILEQVGDRTRNAEMVNLLRHRLGYGDENSNKMFDTNSCLSVANLFKRPVVEICHNGGKITQLSFSLPSVELSIHFRNEMELSQNFVQWCKSSEWQQDRINALSQWLAINLPDTLNFNGATAYDISLGLLQCPTVIALVSIDRGGHFDAAPHKDLKRENSVLEFLREAGN